MGAGFAILWLGAVGDCPVPATTDPEGVLGHMTALLEAAQAYPYLFASLLCVGLVAIAIWGLLPRQQRRMAILSGALSVPFGVFSIFLEGAYWNPVRVVRGPIGIEDFLASFAVGAGAWTAAVLPLHRRLSFRADVRAIPRRLVAPLVYVLTFGGFLALGIPVMSAYLATLAIVIARESLRHPHLRPLAATGALLFAPSYALTMALIFAIWPDFVRQWNPAPPWGIPVLGVPAGELAWSAFYGAGVPLILGGIFRARWREPGSPW